MASPWTVMSINTRYGARADSNGRPQDRWPIIADLIADVLPRILLAQELLDRKRDPGPQAAAERSLHARGWGMRFVFAPSHTDSHTALAYQPDLLRPLARTEGRSRIPALFGRYPGLSPLVRRELPKARLLLDTAGWVR